MRFHSQSRPSTVSGKGSGKLVKKQSKPVKKGRRILGITAIFLLSFFALFVTLRTILLSDLRFLQGLSNASPFFQNGALGQQVLSVLTGIPANPYDRSAFSQTEDGRITYHGSAETRQGVDVSVYQGTIDWNKVKADGIDFAIIRVAARGYEEEGILAEDPNWERNIQGALDAGLSVGVYLFSQAITTQEAEEEAAFLLERIAGYPITYPVVFDWEPLEHSARTDQISNETLTDCCIAFCEAIKKAGYTPMVYCNLSVGLLQYDLSRLSSYDFWLAQYHDIPTFYGTFQIWQYSSTGKVAGISTNVDLNLSFVSYDSSSSEPKES